MPLLPRDLFQVGLVVTDLDDAIRRFTVLGYTFCPVIETRVPMASGDGWETVWLRVALTREFPHVVLVEPPPDTPEGRSMRPGLLHLGVWVDDVQDESAALEAAGVPIAVDGPWVYHQLRDGSLVQLIAREMQPFFQALLSEGR